MNSASQPSPLSGVPSALHLCPKACPTCGQEIPVDKLEEIGGKIAAREREQTLAITAQLQKQHALEKLEAESKAKADLEAVRAQSALREARAREDAEKQLKDTLARAEEGHAIQAAAWQRQLADAEAAQKTVEEMSAAQQAQILTLQESSARKIAAVEAEAKQREQAIRDEAKKDAEAALDSRIADIEKAQRDSDAARITAEQKQSSLAAQLEDMRRTKEVEIAKAKEENTLEIAHAQRIAKGEAEARFLETLAAHESAVIEANAKTREIEAKLAAQIDQFNASIEASLKTQREVLDKAKDDAVNAEKARAFEEHQKLSNKLTDLQRTLDNKTAEELGEGAEIELYDALKKEFPDDDIHRIRKGSQGADIIHVVMLNGSKCGTIIYDSKNHNQFRNEHVSKLRTDQLAAKAQHAILSTRKFPQGTRQLHLQDGILLANPARVVSIVTMIRHHLHQLHTQRVSGIERERKTAALYEFMVSELCASLLARIDERTSDLLEEQRKEMRWHENHWEREGETVRGIQKAKADLTNQINLIIGTSSHDAAA